MQIGMGRCCSVATSPASAGFIGGKSMVQHIRVLFRSSLTVLIALLFTLVIVEVETVAAQNNILVPWETGGTALTIKPTSKETYRIFSELKRNGYGIYVVSKKRVGSSYQHTMQSWHQDVGYLRDIKVTSSYSTTVTTQNARDIKSKTYAAKKSNTEYSIYIANKARTANLIQVNPSNPIYDLIRLAIDSEVIFIAASTTEAYGYFLQNNQLREVMHLLSDSTHLSAELLPAEWVAQGVVGLIRMSSPNIAALEYNNGALEVFAYDFFGTSLVIAPGNGISAAEYSNLSLMRHQTMMGIVGNIGGY